MQTHTEFHSAKAHARRGPSTPIVAWNTPRGFQPRRDEPAREGLSQAELSRIVIDMIG